MICDTSVIASESVPRTSKADVLPEGAETDQLCRGNEVLPGFTDGGQTHLTDVHQSDEPSEVPSGQLDPTSVRTSNLPAENSQTLAETAPAMQPNSRQYMQGRPKRRPRLPVYYKDFVME